MPRLSDVDWNIVIFADTVCDLDGKVLEKPSSATEAAEMLRNFSGRWHQLHTCVHLVMRMNKERVIEREFIETSEIEFCVLDEEVIACYVAKESNWQGKAGGYGIQGKTGSMVKQIRG